MTRARAHSAALHRTATAVVAEAFGKAVADIQHDGKVRDANGHLFAPLSLRFERVQATRQLSPGAWPDCPLCRQSTAICDCDPEAVFEALRRPALREHAAEREGL